jgi:hypothetical protein
MTRSALLKSFLPGVMARAAQSFDKSMLAVIGICWAATAGTMGLALHTLNLAAAAKYEAESAKALEPTLPEIKHSAVGGKELQGMIVG